MERQARHRGRGAGVRLTAAAQLESLREGDGIGASAVHPRVENLQGSQISRGRKIKKPFIN